MSCRRASIGVVIGLGCIIVSCAMSYADKGYNNSTRLYENGAEGIYDGSLHVTGAVRTDKELELVAKSSITIPSTNHAKVYLSSTTEQICTLFDNNTTTCIGGTVGTITGVTAGLGLTGGGTSGTITINLSTPIANASIDGSSITKQGNTFNGNSQLVETTSGGLLPALSGANLTNLNASNLTSGTVPDAALSTSLFKVICSSSITLSSATTSVTWVPTNLGCSGALKTSSDHVVIVSNLTMETQSAGFSLYLTYFVDGSTNLGTSSNGLCRSDVNATGLSITISNCSPIAYYAPGNTSSHAYRVYMQEDGGVTTFGQGGTMNFLVIETN